MEEKKILTDEELDNVVGGKKAGSYMEVPKCLGVDENDNALDEFHISASSTKKYFPKNPCKKIIL